MRIMFPLFTVVIMFKYLAHSRPLLYGAVISFFNYESESRSVVSDSLQPHAVYSPWNSVGQNTEMGSLSLFQGIFQPWDQTQISCIAGGFFIGWATREAQEYWSGPSPEALPNPGIIPGCTELQVDSLPTELSGKPLIMTLSQILFPDAISKERAKQWRDFNRLCDFTHIFPPSSGFKSTRFQLGSKDPWILPVWLFGPCLSMGFCLSAWVEWKLWREW